MSRPAARLRLAALAAGIGTLFALVVLTGSLSPERVRNAIEPLGAAGPIAFVVVSSLLTCALFPGPLLAASSGLLFGTALGTPLSIASATLGGVLAFCIARFAARDAIDTLAGRRLRGVQDWIERRGFVAVLYARIAPGVPYHLVNYVAGLTRIRLGMFAAATTVGVAPRAFAYTALGGSLDDLGSPEAIVAVVVLATMALAGAIALRR
ncbi:MAG: TVP38/TMEM64 family protein, partial [Solirubrobacterales bacterium]|nr:TVP38/TMEM64 family protein [Solirubrobacterales bacterium]